MRTSIAVVVLSLAIILSLELYGRSSRNPGNGGERGDGDVVAVDRPEDLADVLARGDVRGTPLISMSESFYVKPPALVPPPFAGYPIVVPDVPSVILAEAPRENIMLFVLMSGLARSVTHVLPPDTYAARYSGGPPSVRAFFYVLPRYITTLGAMEESGEPVVLYVDASYFTTTTAADAYRALDAKAKPRLIVACLLSDKPGVTGHARDELRRFIDLLHDSAKRT